MEPIVQCLFVKLPMELILLILTFAGCPDFNVETRGDSYASALALCRVSTAVRRVVLPIMLETVFLLKDHHLIAFLHALRMQKNYAEEGNHLSIDYTNHIRKIWVGRCCTPEGPEIDFSILAPVILAAPSLAFDFLSLRLLYGCLQYDSNIHESSPLPWKTKTLALSGHFNPSSIVTNTAEGSAFFSSITRLIFLFNTITEDIQDDEPEVLKIPRWTQGFPWASFKSLRSVLLPLPCIVFPYIKGVKHMRGKRVYLVTLSASPMSAHWLHLSAPEPSGSWVQDLSARTIKGGLSSPGAYKDMDTYSGEGVVCGVYQLCLFVSRFKYQSTLCVDWEEGWACGLE